MFPTRGGNTYLPVFEPNQREQAYGGYDYGQPSNQYDNAFIPPQAPASKTTPPKREGLRERKLRNEARKKQKTEPKPKQTPPQTNTYIPGQELAKTLQEQGKTDEEIGEIIAKSAGLTTEEVKTFGLNPFTLEPDTNSYKAGW